MWVRLDVGEDAGGVDCGSSSFRRQGRRQGAAVGAGGLFAVQGLLVLLAGLEDVAFPGVETEALLTSESTAGRRWGFLDFFEGAFMGVADLPGGFEIRGRDDTVSQCCDAALFGDRGEFRAVAVQEG